ncbi:MAG: TlpA family protein disulfide reductase [Muribaculaceae bacterium]|nr:TlpA family protein disulfide reductase [Muribaculaceae bacterium]
MNKLRKFILGCGLLMVSVPMYAFEYRIISNASDSTLNGYDCVLFNISDSFTPHMAEVQNGVVDITGESERSFPAELYFVNRESGGQRGSRIAFIVEPGTTVVDLNENVLVTGGSLNQELRNYINEIEAYWKSISTDTLANPKDMAMTKVFANETANQEETANAKETTTLKETIKLKSKKIFKENANNGLGEYILMTATQDWSPDEWNEATQLLDDDQKDLEAIRTITSRMDRLRNTWEGTHFVDFEGKSVDGQPMKLSDYVGKGEFVIADIWSSWCGACIIEAQETLIPLYHKYSDNPNVKIIGIALDDVREMAKKMGMPWDQLMNCDKVMGKYAINSIPEIILFGPDGTILNRHLRGEEVEEKLKAAMTANN